MSAAAEGFSDCKTAILQNLGDVQANGALVAVHAQTGRVEYCSANCGELLRIEPQQLLGVSAQAWLGKGWEALSTLAGREGYLQWAPFAGADNLVVVGHRQGNHRIFEFERAAGGAGHWWEYSSRTRFVEQLTAIHDAERCHNLLVNRVFEESGYDRVMLYRFRPDWTGEVVQECCRPGMEGFLGLRFPAGDIPPNARQLFTLNRQRTIVDANSEPCAILRWDGNAQPLDLTYSTLRSAHPAHLRYLQNMGVSASLTLSIVVNGKLWGLIACHHLSSYGLPIEDRLAFEEMARLVSLHLTNLLGLIEQRSHSEMRQRLARLQGAMLASGNDAKVVLSRNLGMIRETFSAGGVWLRFGGEDFFIGRVADRLSLAPLRDFLELLPCEHVSHFARLPASLQSLRALTANASGIIFMPLGSADFIALLRPEVIETVNWAGKPDLAAGEPVATPQLLSPRNSFAVWSEQVRCTAEAWSDAEVEFAEKLRVDLLLFLQTVRLEQIALHDPLTGLANRLLFERRLQEGVRSAIVNSVEGNSAFAVYMIDLDRFKQVNDIFGHASGDQLLKEVAARLSGVVRTGDTVARLGGDEFAILQTGLGDRSVAATTAERIVRAVSQPYEIGGRTVEVGASVGISVCPSDTVEESELLECADLALYEVKRSGRNAFSLYSPAMKGPELQHTDGERLDQALRDNEFRLDYQPVVDARSGELRGLEAFLRWRQPGCPELTAGEFMPSFERKRVTPQIAQWTMETVFKQYQQWLREGLALVPVTINIGNADFATQDLLGQIERLGTRYDTGWQWLRLDIKEQALVADIGHAIRKIGKLRDAGVGANLDNFGRGFVPLGYLTQLPFRGIKLDATLFEHESGRQHLNALFNVVKSVAQVFKAQLTVTRVESRQMREALVNQSVDLLQGYAIAPPEPAGRVAGWLREPRGHTQFTLPVTA